MEKQLFTVVMSCYNSEKFLKSTLSSIIAQTYQNWELLAVDDTSDDSTYDILKEFAAKDSRIRLFRQKENKGLTYNLNLLVSYAKGDYIVRHDADDISLPERFEAMYEYVSNNKACSLIYSDYYIIDDEDNILCLSQPVRSYDSLVSAFSQGYNPIAHGSVVFKKEDVVKIGGYCESVIKGQDYDLYLRLILNKNKFSCLERPLYKQRVHGESINQGHFNKNTVNYKSLDREVYAKASLMAYHDGYKKQYNYYLDTAAMKNKNLNKVYPSGYSECLYALVGGKRKYIIKKAFFLIKTNPCFLKSYLLLLLSLIPFSGGKFLLTKRMPYFTLKKI